MVKSQEFWNVVLLLLAIVSIASLIFSFGLVAVANNLERQLVEKDVELYSCQQDIKAKNSLFINECRRGNIWACGLGVE